MQMERVEVFIKAFARVHENDIACFKPQTGSIWENTGWHVLHTAVKLL